MAVLNAGCRWERCGFSLQFQTLVVGGGESVVLISVSDAGCEEGGWRGRGTNGSPIC